MLSKAGYAVRIAEGPHQAMKMWREQRADLLVSDVRMPEMSGAELCRQLEEHTPELRTVFITGFAPSEAALRIEPGRRVVVPKPFSREQLLSAVRDLLAW
jgi:two-component system catabolic regulation response regulator CreB